MRVRNRIVTTLMAVGVAAMVLPLQAGSPSRPDLLAKLSPSQTVPQQDSKAQGHAWFYLNENQTRLRYEIKLNGLGIAGRNVPGKGMKDIVFAAHIRHGAPGTEGPIVLAFFGSPGQEDENLRVDPIVPTIGGVWDDSDRNEDTGSRMLSEMLAYLCAGELYINIQTVNYPTGALRGQIEPQPNACR